MVSKKETDQFLTNERIKFSSESTTCYSKWWNQGFQHQKVISRIIESYYFHALIIFLVVLDTALVIGEIMLDSFLIHYECEGNVHKTPKEHNKISKEHHEISKEHKDISKERIELAMEIAHFSSIGILVFFVIELLIRIYASGKEFWNIRKRKMEYFDAFIVITSLIIDLYFLGMEKTVLGDKLLLIFSFRLWRFLRIINSVAEGIRHGESKRKEHLNKQYLIAVHRLIDIIKHKTNYIENNNENFSSIVRHFQVIDNKCQSSFDELSRERELTTSAIVAQFIEDLNGLEKKNDTSIISAMFINSSSV